VKENGAVTQANRLHSSQLKKLEEGAGTSHMNNIRQTSFAKQRFVDSISMVTQKFHL
jgi:hypothetical protein